MKSWLIAVAIAASAAGFAQDPKPVRAPVEMCGNLFFVPITLQAREGYPEDRTLWFVYDTGASNTHVDPDSIERATGRRFEDVERVRIVDASSGPLQVRKLQARVSELDHLSLALGREIDGILAFTAFREFLLTLDYQAGEIRLERGALPEPDRRTVFDAAGPDKRPWLEVTIAGTAEQLLIDSGAMSEVIKIRDLDRFDTLASPRLTHSTIGMDKVERHYGARLDGIARIGPHVFVNPRISETTGTKLVGGELMRHFVWTFDQRNDRVRIEAINSGAEIRLPPLVGLGVMRVPRDGALEIFDVIPATPAERAGLRKGDRITHVNGRPVAARGCEHHDLEDGDAVVLSVLRGDEALEISVTVEILVE